MNQWSKAFPQKSPGPDGFIGYSYQTLKEELTPVLFKLKKKNEEEGTPPNSSYKASNPLKPKPEKDTIRKKTADQCLWWI